MADKRETDEHSGIETTGHEWDGIKELDNPLPRWWLYIFYASIAASLVYWVLMPAWPLASSYTQGLLGRSDRAEVAKELALLKTQRSAQFAKLENASLADIEQNPDLQAYALAAGGAVFGDNCATCHGTGGAGAKGYPNLRDDVWLWGGSLEDIQHTLRVGIRSGHPEARVSQMPAYGRDGLLEEAQITDLTHYVMSLSGMKHNAAAAGRATVLFAEQCASCHGAEGKGMVEQGAPDLTDKDWLYAGTEEAIHAQIWNGRNGVMPSWEKRFDAATIKALAVYVHVNAGGAQ